MIDPNVKGAWLAALRSGQYQQATSFLHRLIGGDSPGYCCLGVLCETQGVPSVEEDGMAAIYDFDEVTASATLPYSFRAKVGLTSTEESDLIKLNDEDHLPFGEIADWVQENL